MLGVSGTPVLDAVGKLGDLGDRPSDKRTLYDPDSWTDDPAGRAVGRMRLRYILSTTIRSDGDYPLRGFPCDRFLLYASGWPLMPSMFPKLPTCLLTIRLVKAHLTIRTRPLMGRTYSRLGATFGSPKLRLLSLSPLPPVLLLQFQQSIPPLHCVLLCAAPLSNL